MIKQTLRRLAAVLHPPQTISAGNDVLGSMRTIRMVYPVRQRSHWI